MFIKAPVLAYYNPKLPLALSVDDSLKGLGANIIQKWQTNGICFTSCQKFHLYNYGRTVTVECDHKPSEFIFR